MTRILIAYYSRRGANYVSGSIVDLPVGNTEVAAGLIQAVTGGDTFHIETREPYPADYQEATEVAEDELRRKARPALAADLGDLDAYDVIFLGYPNWWNTMPMVVFTFLEAHDLKGKTLVPFCTHEGSGLGGSEGDIRKACPGATVLKGLAIKGSAVQKSGGAIAGWIKGLGLETPGVRP